MPFVSAPDKFERILERAEDMTHEELLDTLQQTMSYLDDIEISELLSYIANCYED